MRLFIPRENTVISHTAGETAVWEKQSLAMICIPMLRRVNALHLKPGRERERERGTPALSGHSSLINSKEKILPLPR